MKRSDINFFTVFGLALIWALFSLVTGFDVPFWAAFWWVLLIPGAVVLVLFKNTKLGKWYTSDFNFKKRIK